MAALATHIVLTNKVFSTYFADKNKTDFYIGTSFPDIRYLGVIKRDKVHFDNLHISDIQTIKSFDAGLKFHSIVDKIREDFITSREIYSLISQSRYSTQAIKFFEDWLLYEKLDNWCPYVDYFNYFPKGELSYGISLSAIQKWHKLLQAYLSSKPDSESIRQFVKVIGRPKDMAEEIILLIEEMKNNKELIQIVNDFYNNFESLIVKIV